ncbi:sulfite exporter TauE/SafE family protein [Flexithrix dorotheae]|uniref:sulfite exporter TauE/SafE family protein n=1 Tax=Flexithrix dorotheae TaxID=70993 RepID=UPI00037570D0|nr:sulfite exporter TauE/SafE family protein [Flexithrix dorotheae]
MEIQWYHYILMLSAGVLAGIVNTLAGSGSVFTLSVFIFLGLPANMANGTNRVGVTIQSLISTYTFYKGGKLNIAESKKFLIPTFLGALIGAMVAVDMDEELLRLVIGWIMVVLLVITIFKPQKKLLQENSKSRRGMVLNFLVFLAIGFYGGFIQAGIGIFLLVALHLAADFNLVQANGAKLLAVMLFSFPVLFIFLYNGQVEWVYGLWVAVGQAIGSYGASKFAVKSTNANTWVRKILIAMILLSIFKMFGWLDWITEKIMLL